MRRCSCRSAASTSRAAFLIPCRLGGQLEQELHSSGREVELFEKLRLCRGVGHEDSFVQVVMYRQFFLCVGQGRLRQAGPAGRALMQCGPPRPRPTSEPGMVRDLDAMGSKVLIRVDVTFIGNDDTGGR